LSSLNSGTMRPANLSMTTRACRAAIAANFRTLTEKKTMPRRKPFDPLADRWAAVLAVRDARAKGVSLRQASAAAGVHISTVCRWQARCPAIHRMLHDAERTGWRVKHAAEYAAAVQVYAAAVEGLDWVHLHRRLKARPHVPWRRDCPLCRSQVVVRTASGRLTFWRCGRWPLCPWASWRPRAPEDCPKCGSPSFWSHSRKSVNCGGCGMRIYPTLTDSPGR
jgi:hypothetical protein